MSTEENPIDRSNQIKSNQTHGLLLILATTTRSAGRLFSVVAGQHQNRAFRDFDLFKRTYALELGQFTHLLCVCYTLNTVTH